MRVYNASIAMLTGQIQNENIKKAFPKERAAYENSDCEYGVTGYEMHFYSKKIIWSPARIASISGMKKNNVKFTRAVAM